MAGMWRPHCLAVSAALLAAGACRTDAGSSGSERRRTSLSAARTVAPPSAEQTLRLVQDGDAVFFVGNSFFGFGDRPLPTWVENLGAAMEPPLRIETGSDIVFGNLPLAEFLRHENTQAALASRKYDVFVLQGEEFEPVDDKTAFHAAVREFHTAIQAAGARTVLFMTWEFAWRPFIDELAAAYDEIGTELGIPVIPAGLVYADCADSPPKPGLPRHFLTASRGNPRGDLHQNEMGTAVNAYATFALLTGLDPRGTTFAAPGNTNPPEAMDYFAHQAWARVVPRLHTQLYQR